MKTLSPHDVVGNCRIAFDAATGLGIPRVIEPKDMSLLAVPDKLAVMTYLYQLRAHFTGHQLQIEQIGNTSDESSYIIGNYKSDNFSSHNLLNFDHIKKQLIQQFSIEEDVERNDDRSPLDKKDVKNIFLTGSKHLLEKVLSPAKDKQFSTIQKIQQTNPDYGEDEENLPLQTFQTESNTDNQRNNHAIKIESTKATSNIDPSTANVCCCIKKKFCILLY